MGKSLIGVYDELVSTYCLRELSKSALADETFPTNPDFYTVFLPFITATVYRAKQGCIKFKNPRRNYNFITVINDPSTKSSLAAALRLDCDR